MQSSIFLVLSKKGVIRLAKKAPKLNGDERSVMIDISVDDSIFDYTFLKTNLDIKEDDVITPSLSVEVNHSLDKL